MATKDPAIDARKSTILRQVISEHIQTGQPIGSAHVVRNPEIDVSPATVRSDMAALEREGYLTHPHTSAGRIPTDKGYRYFVDHLDESNALDPASAEQVEAFFKRAHGELERMLRDTSRLLSQLTDYASVVVGPTHEALTIRSSLLARLGPRTALLVVVLSDGVVEKRSLEIDEAVSDADIEQANASLREQLPGQTLGRLAPMTISGVRTIDRIVQSCYAVLPAIPPFDSSGEDVFVGGASHMADQFGAAETVREVLAILEQSFVVVSLISDLLAQGRSVAIGAESGLPSLAECSLVVAPYEVSTKLVGTIGVLGPTRMNYPQALATVAVVSQRLSRELSGN
ncbi:MAG TPA: heat-inducible transcriptional repressor HrcA [Acidimicrobiales bacterium]|nr:heat-inducible transcriptional repressor HrcA [Acidimicrobiales bacterium]